MLNSNLTNLFTFIYNSHLWYGFNIPRYECKRFQSNTCELLLHYIGKIVFIKHNTKWTLDIRCQILFLWRNILLKHFKWQVNVKHTFIFTSTLIAQINMFVYINQYIYSLSQEWSFSHTNYLFILRCLHNIEFCCFSSFHTSFIQPNSILFIFLRDVLNSSYYNSYDTKI